MYRVANASCFSCRTCNRTLFEPGQTYSILYCSLCDYHAGPLNLLRMRSRLLGFLLHEIWLGKREAATAEVAILFTIAHDSAILIVFICRRHRRFSIYAD